jgi:hypothetical protein
MKLSQFLLGSLVTQKATGEIRWTSDQASLIQDRDGHDTSKWDNVSPGRNRGVTDSSLATPWNTVDGDGNLEITYFNKVGTGHRGNSAEKGQINDALAALTAMTNGCINFKEHIDCDAWMDVNCAPSGNHVEIECAPGGQFDSGCWSELGMIGGRTGLSLESASCSNDDTHCFTRYSGMGRVHQQFLHALGIVGEHQRGDAASHVTVQSTNIDLTAEQIAQRFSPISVDDWVNTGSGFDFCSVTMNGFYDFNKLTFADLTSTWDPSLYSVVRAGDAFSDPIWPNRYRASTTDIIQLMDMYSSYPNCDSSMLDTVLCADGTKVLKSRKCDGALNDCPDGSDESSECIDNPFYQQNYCCADLSLTVSLGFIMPGLTETASFDAPTWNSQYGRPTYQASIVTQMANSYTLLGSQYSHVFLAPVEAQTDPLKCGTSSYITWVLHYGVSDSDVVTCETYFALKNGLSETMYFLDEALDSMSDASYCPLTVAGGHFSNLDVATGSERHLRCGDDDVVVTTQEPGEETTTQEPGEETTVEQNTNPCDSDPCTDPNHECVEDSNADGGFVCNCADGYIEANDVETGESGCANINECNTMVTECESIPNQVCQDNDGSYDCVCDSGYEMDDNDDCVDIDECVTEANTCGQECENTDGGFTCECAMGYEADGNGNCGDIDECADEADNECDAEHPCVNMVGSYTCTCDSGYEWDSGACVDINECERGVCSAASLCENSDGGYSCTCPTGFDDLNGDGEQCEYTNYPQGWNWYPSFDQSHQLWISGNDPDTGFATSYFDVYSSLGDKGLMLLLCEDYFSIPFGVLVPGISYVCDDTVQRLAHQRYSNQNEICCSYKDYVVTCDPGCAHQHFQYVARSASADACTWDNDAIGAYEWTSNDGNKYDTAMCTMDVSADEAAEICASRGARMFNEEVYLFTEESFFAAPALGGCNAVIEMYSKAHGRLYQLSKIDVGYSGRTLTGYRANDALDNWCWFDGTTCHDTQANTPIGVWIEAATAWLPNSGEPDCSIAMIATAVNQALSSEIDALPMTPSSANDCLAFDLATKEMVVVGCDGGLYDTFVCERLQWDCAANGGLGSCSHECDDAGFCSCPAGMFLADFFTCSEEPSMEMIECYETYMVAWFPVADVNYVETLTLNDPTCVDNIQVVGNMYRIEVALDACGTTVEYGMGYSELIFKNTFASDIDMDGIINIQTRVSNTFECHYDAIITVDDVNNAGADGGDPGTVNVEVERSELEKEDVGLLSFTIETFASDAFALELSAGFNSRVGETLHFAVVPQNILSNLVFQTTSCSVLSEDKSVSYQLFENEVADSFVSPMRYRPYYSDGNTMETCAVEEQDKYSYTVFEFLDDTGTGATNGGQQQHIQCSIMVCIKEDDMSSSPCGTNTCSFWDDAGQAGFVAGRRRRSPEGITLDTNTKIIFGA